jgi:putative transposase
VRFDPYDLSQIWVREHRTPDGGFLRAVWTHLPMVSAPFADFTWRHATQLTAAGGQPVDETEIARTLDELLTRAGDGPAGDQRVVARTRAATAARHPVEPEPEPKDDGFDDDPLEQ